jgi:hypothetical protein
VLGACDSELFSSKGYRLSLGAHSTSLLLLFVIELYGEPTTTTQGTLVQLQVCAIDERAVIEEKTTYVTFFFHLRPVL